MASARQAPAERAWTTSAVLPPPSEAARAQVCDSGEHGRGSLVPGRWHVPLWAPGVSYVTSEGPPFLNPPLSLSPAPFFPLQGSNPGTVPPPGRLPGWLAPPRRGERPSVLGTIFPAPPGQAHNSLWSLGSPG